MNKILKAGFLVLFLQFLLATQLQVVVEVFTESW